MALTITNNLIMSGSATFNSATNVGFATLNYTQTGLGAVVTLKGGVTYTVSGQLTITGTAGTVGRCVLKSDTVITTAGFATAGNLTVSIATTVPAAPIGGYNYIMSQSTLNTFLLGKATPGMNGSDVNDISSFPVISAGSVPIGGTLTVSRPFSMSQRGVQIGLSAKFIHTAGVSSRNITFVNTFDIDSRGSTEGPIRANFSYPNRVGIPNPNLWRTLNWDSLLPLAPLVTVAYVD
jgi:hypothetical protein